MKTIEQVVYEIKLINDLQKIEAGIINGLTPDLVELITSVKFHNYVPASGLCTICETDIFVLHHIKSYKSQRNFNNDESLYDGIVGEIWICPNCHYRIHSCNPYFKRRYK